MSSAHDLASSVPLRAKAEAFLLLAEEALLDGRAAGEALARGAGYQFILGTFFSTPDALMQAQFELVKPVLQKLGTLSGSEKELRALTWRHAREWAISDAPKDIKVAARGLLQDMGASGREAVDLYLPNYTFQLDPGVEGVTLGSVAILPSTSAAQAVEPFAQTLRVNIDGGHGQSYDDGVVTHFMPVCWRVRLNASPHNVRDEGAWMIDVAISLARALHRPWKGLPPDLKDREPNAFAPTEEKESGFYVTADRYGCGAMTKARYYLIDAVAAANLMSERNQAIARLIFDPPLRSLAERVAQGLGWLTRGRRAQDRSEAFLHFFTALEALFSGERGQPVTATIARHFAVIWSDDPDVRRVAAKWLMQLYETRSALVHAGRREVLEPDVRNLHNAADRIFRAVLLNVDLEMAADTFASQLRDASYGSLWPHRA